MADDLPTDQAISSTQELSQQISPETPRVIKGNPSRDDPSHRSFMGASRFATRQSYFFVLGLIAFGGMAALLFHADQLLDKSLHQMRLAGHLTSLAARVESATLALNSDSQNFIKSKDLRYAENYKKRSESLTGDLKQLMEDPDAPEAQKMATTLNDGVAQHAGQFTNIVNIQTLLGFDNKAGISGNAEASLASFEDRLNQLGSRIEGSGIQPRFGDVKNNELRFGQDPTAKNLQQTQIDIGLLNKSIVSSALNDTEKKTLLTLLQSHRSDITQLGRTRITLSKEVAQLGEINTYMAPTLDALINFTGNFALLARQENKSTQDFIRQIIAGGSGGILLILIIFGIMIIRSMSKPTAQVAEISMELAHGNVSAPIPYLGNYDEIGEISNALTVFRENMLQADRLRKDLEITLKQNENVKIVNPETIEPEVESDEMIDATLETPTTSGHDLIPNSHNLPSVVEQQIPEEEGQDLAPQLPIGKGAITEISHQLTETSQTASKAAEEAERSEKMVNGLEDATDKIEDIEILMIGISDQMSLLAVQTALLEGDNDSESENLIRLDEKRNDKKAPKRSNKPGAGQSVSDRIDTIQNGTKRAIKAVQSIGNTIEEVNEVAKDLSSVTSKQALLAANDLLRQSEDLRTMLDNLLGKVSNNETEPSQAKDGD